jgi:putative ABC transport system permease protein
MRTALTMLGIIIGVAVVILVVAIGQGATKQVTDAVNSLGTNLLIVLPGTARIRVNAATLAAASGSGQVNRLKMQDAKLIAQDFSESIAAVAPFVRSNTPIKFMGKDSTTGITGTTVDYPFVNAADVDRGRFFTQQEVDASLKVCCVGVTIADKLTGDITTDMTGMTISIQNQDFKIVGMMAPKGSGSFGQDQDDVIVMPITTAMRRILNTIYINAIFIRCTTPQMMPVAQEQISNFLRNEHHLPPPFPDNDDFNIRSQTEIMERQASVANTMSALLSAVAVISLVVGGIGIMNIMLVSVTERTREIGIRKAIGATPRDILLQFLIESSIISLIGGIIGIGIGIGGTRVMNDAGYAAIVNTTAVVTALVVSAAVGLFFGIYPAQKASQLHPIEALRFE